MFNWQKHYRAITLTIFLLLLPGCAYLGKNTVFLTDKDKVYIVPSNAKVPVIWANKNIEILTDEDMVMLYKGTYLNLEREANKNILK